MGTKTATRKWLPSFGLVLAIALASASTQVSAGQAFAFGWNPRTGDALLDARLADINAYGDRYRAAFVDELVRYHAAPRALAGALLADERWAPGDLYFACALAEAVGRPCRFVIDLWRESHATGWGAVAERLDVTRDSPDFRRIAEGVVASYRRWGRPLPEVEPVVESAAKPAAEGGATAEEAADGER